MLESREIQALCAFALCFIVYGGIIAIIQYLTYKKNGSKKP